MKDCKLYVALIAVLVQAKLLDLVFRLVVRFDGESLAIVQICASDTKLSHHN